MTRESTPDNKINSKASWNIIGGITAVFVGFLIVYIIWMFFVFIGDNLNHYLFGAPEFTWEMFQHEADATGGGFIFVFLSFILVAPFIPTSDEQGFLGFFLTILSLIIVNWLINPIVFGKSVNLLSFFLAYIFPNGERELLATVAYARASVFFSSWQVSSTVKNTFSFVFQLATILATIDGCINLWNRISKQK